MTVSAVAIKMLDIYFSNFLIGMGYATAAGILLLLVERHMDKRDEKERARARRRNPASLDE